MIMNDQGKGGALYILHCFTFILQFDSECRMDGDSPLRQIVL